MLSAIEFQEGALRLLRATLSSKAVPHAWLFQGPDGVGKELAALSLAQALICPERPFDGCGQCASCQRVGRRNHPDVTWVLPEHEQVARGFAGRSDFDHVPSRDIRIEQVRRLQERLAFRPLEGLFKVALLVGADALNANAQNALLKTLEEPPRDTVLILISSAPDKLLPTIRSRCAKAQFGPLPADFIARKLKELNPKLDPTQAASIALMAGGSLARAVSLDPGALEERRELIERFEGLTPGDARAWLALAESVGEDRASAESALEVLQVWLRDVAVAQVGGAQLLNSDLEELAREAALRVSPASLQRRLGLIDETKNAIRARSGAARLQLERLFIEMFAG